VDMPDGPFFAALGDYVPVSNVLEHSQISKDIAAFGAALKGDDPDYAAAKAIYEKGGGNSCKNAAKTRTLQAFATADLKGESFYDAFTKDDFVTAGWWDRWILSALDGTGVFQNASRTKRVTCLTKGVMGLVTLYASHELEAGIAKAEEQSKRSDAVSGHAWDEGWAFYYGADAGASAPWEVATKRDGDFPNGLEVNTSIVPHFNKGLIAVRSATYSDTLAKEARDTIYRMWAVTYLRAALKYLQISENKTNQDKAHSEGYAYFMAIDGWVHSKGTTGATAATLMRSKLDITQSVIPSGSYCEAKAALEAAYPAMGLSCDIMGTFKDESITCAACTSADAKFPSGDGAVFPVEGTAKDITCDPNAEAEDVNAKAEDVNAKAEDMSRAAVLQSWLPSLLALVTLMAA